MASQPGPPPPPPPPGIRGAPMGQRPPQPPPGVQMPPPRPGGGPPPPGMPMPMPIRQQSIRIQDITPPKMMDESACLKKLTTYQAYTIRKCPPRDPKKEGLGTWARAEVIEERLAQEDITKQIKKLGERGRSVADKKKALAPNMQGQIATLLDDLASKERDRAFEWSLVQLDTVTKPVSLKGGKKGGLYETVTMTAYVKRSPLKDLNPIMLFQNIEKMKAESMRPPPPPQAPPHDADEIIRIEKGGGSKDRAKGRSKSREKKFHDHGDSSSGDSFDSDTDSHSSYTSDSAGTTISSKSRGHRRHSHDRGGAFRSHSRHREPRRKMYFLEQPRPHSPEHLYDAYGSAPQPYAPDAPRQPPFDPVAAAYHAGIADANAERYGTADRVVTRPVERIIEKVVIEPRPVISYGRMEPRLQEHRFSEPRLIDERYVNERRRDDEYLLRRREAEEYIDGRLDGRADGRRPSEYIDRRPIDMFYDRRQSEPVIWTNRNPFSPILSPTHLPRRYSPSSSASGW